MNGETYEANRYALKLRKVAQNSAKYGLYLGLGMGALFGCLNASYALGFWYGSHCVEGS